MSEIVKAIVAAPLATLFIISGMIFLLIAAIGNISGKIEPGAKGRVFSGAIGLVFIIVGIAMHLTSDKSSIEPPDNKQGLDETGKTPLQPAIGAISPTEKGLPPNRSTATLGESPIRSQSLSWGPDQGKDAGVCLDECSNFVPWSEFSSELEKLVLPLTPNLPPNTSTKLASISGQKARGIQLTDQAGNVLANVWVGVNPKADWRFDGLLRIGSANSPPKVWASFERLSNGSYRRH